MLLTTEIILVDDETYVSEFIQQLLEPFGIKTLAIAANGKELIPLLRHFTPDIIVLDLEMPVMNGLETFEYLAARFPNLKVIILSKYKDPSLMRNYLSCNASAYFTKSIIETPSKMAEAILEVKHKGYYRQNTPLGGTWFTTSEIEVMKKLAHDKTSREIAGEICITKKTVDKVRTRLHQKTGTRTSTGLIAKIINNGYYLMSGLK